jgi:hypothetical protein
MKPFNRLCPQCQRPLTSNEMYCSWCNTYSPEARPNTTTTFPPPPPPYTDLPSQNWTQTGPMRDFPGEKLLSPQQPPRKKLNKPLLIGSSILGVFLLLVGSFFIGKISGTNGNSSTTTTLSTSATTSSSQTGPTSVASTPSNQTTPTSLPTASLKSPQLPLIIPCVNCSYPQLTVTLSKIDIDSLARSTRWKFSFLNNGSSACSPTFWSVYLTDQDGTNYSGKGQVSNGSSFSLDAGGSVQINSSFDVLPVSGTEYTLTLQIHVGSCKGSGALNPYQTENFTFA